MQVLLDRVPLNRWDKDSIRPGPVGSVGDVNLQVKLKKSSPDMPNRYDKTFSGKNEVWSGSNVSDGQWTGYTSGGRGAVTLSKPLAFRSGFKTPVGYVFENVTAADRTQMAKMVPLGQYSWEEEKAKIYKSKVTGEQFLPLPMGYEKTTLPRGSHFPQIVAESSGLGTALPAADVNITDSQFGKQGSIQAGCQPADLLKIWVPAMDDPRRKFPSKDTFLQNAYPFYDGRMVDGIPEYRAQFPPVGEKVTVYNRALKTIETISTSPCGRRNRDLTAPENPTAREGDYRRDEQKREEEKRKQKMK